MAKRLYTLQDIKDFLKVQYGLDWRNATIIKNGRAINLQEEDLTNLAISMLAIVMENNTKTMYRMYISNTRFEVYGKNSQIKSRCWKKFLANRDIEKNQENTI